MADVFISYAREDRGSAKRLAEAIEARGWTVWWDRRIPAGKSYEDVIEREVDAAACVVVLWTRSSVASEWVRNEAGEGARRKALIPIRLEDVRVPLSFRHLHAGDLLAWTSAELEDCLGSIESMIGAPKRMEEPPAVEPTIGESQTVPSAEVISVEPVEAMSQPFVTPFEQQRRLELIIAVLVVLSVIAVATLIANKEKPPTKIGTMPTEAPVPDTSTMATTDVQVFVSETDTSATNVTTWGEVAAMVDVVEFRTTAGTFIIELFPEAAPNHVSNFVKVASSGGFDGSTFFSIVQNGLAAGYVSPKPYVQQETNDLARPRGTIIGLASSPSGAADFRTGFWITTADDSFDLNRKKNSVFGRVIEGMDVIDRIAKAPVDKDGRPVKPIMITRAFVRHRNRA